MSSVCSSITLNRNIHSFLFEQSRNPNFIAFIEENNQGLSDPELENNLKNGKYSEVLTALWSEKNCTRRVKWLQSKFEELHPILMYELAVASFQHSKTAQTINDVCNPLLAAADFRVSQDTKCVDDPFLNTEDFAAKSMHCFYYNKLFNEIDNLENKSRNECNNALNNISKEKNWQKILEVAYKSLGKDLPAPDWVGWLGSLIYISREPKTFDANIHKEIRDLFAKTEIKNINNNITVRLETEL